MSSTPQDKHASIAETCLADRESEGLENALIVIRGGHQIAITPGGKVKRDSFGRFQIGNTVLDLAQVPDRDVALDGDRLRIRLGGDVVLVIAYPEDVKP